MFDKSACSIERTKDHNYLIRWRTSPEGQVVSIYMSDNPAHFYRDHGHPSSIFDEPVLHTSNHEVVIPNPELGVRHYFYLETEGGESISLAERKLSLQGTPNFRDLGGYETYDGRHLKWGKIYRSGRLCSLTESDVHYFSKLGVSLVCDFRQEIERDLEPTWLGHENAPAYTGLPIMPGSSESFMANLYKGIIEVYDSAGFMKEVNRDFVINQMPQYAEMFRLMLDGHQQILIHCASGKDRTGFGAALILEVLGVEKETIISDYLLTNEYLSVEKEIEQFSKDKAFTDLKGAVVPDSVLRPLIEVRPEYLNACFEEIDSRYESREQFYKQALGIDSEKLEQLRNFYLE